MFYDKYQALCVKKGISMSKAADEIGFDRSSVTQWKKKGFTPRQEILIKIADYFNVSVDYLLGAEKKEATAANSDETLRFALWGGDSDIVDEEMLEDVRDFAKMLAEKKKRKMERKE